MLNSCLSWQFSEKLAALGVSYFAGWRYVVLLDVADAFLGYFQVVGDPGMGKSSILAKYVHDIGCIVYFNVKSSGICRADQFLKSICTQLNERYNLGYDPLPSDAVRDGEFLAELLQKVSEQLE